MDGWTVIVVIEFDRALLVVLSSLLSLLYVRINYCETKRPDEDRITRRN